MAPRYPAEKVAEVEAALKDGTLHVFDCSTFTVGGEELTTYTTAYGLERHRDGFRRLLPRV